MVSTTPSHPAAGAVTGVTPENPRPPSDIAVNGHTGAMTALGRLLLERSEDDRPALLYEDRRWTYRELVHEGWRRAALFAELRDPDRPPHVGVLLDNVPDYLFWLTAGRPLGHGRRRDQLDLPGRPARPADRPHRLPGTGDLQRPRRPARRRVAHDPVGAGAGDRRARPRRGAGRRPSDRRRRYPPPSDDDLFLLIFTSGSTGLPKAVRCTQGRIGRTGAHVAGIAELTDDDVVYAPLPFFHAASLFTGWASAVHAGHPDLDPEALLRHRHRARHPGLRGHVPDLHGQGPQLHPLACPRLPDDADVPLRLAIGNEASEHDIREFARRFDCQVRDSYGSTEGVIIIRRDPSMPAGALGTADDSVKVLDPETGAGVPAGGVRRPAPGHEPRSGRRRDRRDPADRRASRATTATRRPPSDASATAPTGPATWPTATPTAGSTSPAGRTTGCGSTARTSPPGRWRRSSAATPTCGRSAVYAVPDDPVGDRVMAGPGAPRRRDLRPGGLRRVPPRPARPRPEVGPRLRPGRRRAPEAVEHEAGQEGAPARRLAGRPGGVASGPPRRPPSPHRRGPRDPRPPAQTLTPSRSTSAYWRPIEGLEHLNRAPERGWLRRRRRAARRRCPGRSAGPRRRAGRRGCR